MNQMFVSSLIFQKKETLIGCFTTFNPKAPIGTKESDFPIKIYQFRGDNTQKEKQPTVTWDSVCFNRDGESERLAKLSDVKISEEKSMGLDQAERTASHEGWSAKRSRQLCWKKNKTKSFCNLKVLISFSTTVLSLELSLGDPAQRVWVCVSSRDTLHAHYKTWTMWECEN